VRFSCLLFIPLCFVQPFFHFVSGYNRALLNLILYKDVDFAKMINVKVVSLAQAPEAYKSFDQGEAVKYVIDPNGIIADHMKNKSKL
jgi:hypothetical protein